MIQEKRYSARFTIPAISALYFLIGVTQWLGSTYMTLYINGLDFTDNLSVGLIIALCHIVTAIGQLLWGNLADKSRTKNKILFILLTGFFITTWFVIVPRHTSFGTLIPSVIALNLFSLIPLSIFDAIVVENIDTYGIRFGTVRCYASAGSAGAPLLLFIMGLFFVIVPRTGLIVMACAAVLGLLPMYFLPPTRGHAYGRRESRLKELALLMKNRRFLLLLAFGLVHFTCTGAYAAFFSIYYTSGEGLGASLGLFSLYCALATAGEAILILVGNKFFMKINIYWTFLWAPVMGIFRALWAFLAPNPYIYMLGGVFQAMLLPPLWSRAAPYICSIMRDEARATGQAVWSIVIMGIGPAIGAAIAGVVTKVVGLHSLFLVIACMQLFTVLVFFFLFRAQRAADIREGFITETVTKVNIGKKETKLC